MLGCLKLCCLKPLFLTLEVINYFHLITTITILSCLFTVSHRYGYGLMDAGAMVELAQSWTNVPTQRTCQINAFSGTRYDVMKLFIPFIISIQTTELLKFYCLITAQFIFFKPSLLQVP